MARRSGRINKPPVIHTRGVLRDRSVSRAPSEGVKQVRIRSPTPMGLPPSLNDIVGEASPERAKGPTRKGQSSPIPFPGMHSIITGHGDVVDEGMESLQDQESGDYAGSTIGTSPSPLNESEPEHSSAMFIVGESEHASTPPSPSGSLSSSEYGIYGAAADADEEMFSPDLIVGEVTEDDDLPQPWPSVPVSEGDDSSQSSQSSGPGSHISSPQHMGLIIGEVDDGDSELGGWDTQSEDEGTPVSSSGTNSSVSSPRNALLIVGEAEASDFDSPPQSWASQSDGGVGELSSRATSSTNADTSDDPNALTKDSLTLTPVPGADDTTIGDLLFDFPVEAFSSSPAQPASQASTQPSSSPPDSANPSSSYMRKIDVKVNAAHHLSQLRSEREEVADALEGISNAEETALALQNSAFSTHPQYWRAYQLSLWIRTAEVNDAWDQLVQR